MGFVWLSFIVGIITMLCALWRTVDAGLHFFSLQNVLTLGLYLLFAPVAFFGPVVLTARLISAKKQELLERNEGDRREIVARTGNGAEAERDEHDLDRLEKERKRLTSISVWPYSRGIRQLFAAQYIFMVVGILAGEALRKLLSYLLD